MVIMWHDKFLLNAIGLAVLLKWVATEDKPPAWKWSCEDGKCIKSEYNPAERIPALGLEACKMFCNEYGLLWPRPTGELNLGNFLFKMNMNDINIQLMNHGKSDDLMQDAIQRFREMITYAVPKGLTPKAAGKRMNVYIENANPNVREFSLDMDESYEITISPSSAGAVNVTIKSNSFFGARHAMETLSQVAIYDENRNQMLMTRDFSVTDKPVYPYRGLLIDTARNYYDADSIKRTINAMAAVKLNTLHWHITDSQSFPFVVDRRPELAKLGAYGPRKIYTQETIREIVRYGLVRGIRVLPEFDAPAHVGEGWQETNLTVCFKAEPWASFCVEPPCGQLNPIKDELYDYLEDIYTAMADAFNPDIFHMGGDEVSDKCWNSSKVIQNFMLQRKWGLQKSSFLKLWDYFQTKARDKAYKAFGKKQFILWSSTLTDYNEIEKYLSKDEYIIQMWTTGADPTIMGLLQKGYRLILSNYDALYFDCGFGAWVGSGNNWCSPYIGWQKVYDNSPALMAKTFKDQILGGEAALWSEQSDDKTLDGRMWPRAAALAERLWAEPEQTWQDAEYRMLHTRERLVRMGIQADSIQPEWCYQNEGYCYR